MSKIASIQLASGPHVSANLLETERLVSEAADNGADLVVLPENFAFMGEHETDKLDLAEEAGSGTQQEFLANLSQRLGIWLVGGTIPIKSEIKGKVRSSCLLYNTDGEAVTRYDKMHLFDVNVPDSDENYLESEAIDPGDHVVVADTPCGRLGLAVCYDLRFPEMFRSMLDEGMELLAVPSAFTAITGRAHWEILVRARAIENLCYVAAAGQGGYHVGAKETYGDSMIVDPWGVILDRIPRGAGFVIADVDKERVRTVRKTFPSVDHRRVVCKVANA